MYTTRLIKQGLRNNLKSQINQSAAARQYLVGAAYNVSPKSGIRPSIYRPSGISSSGNLAGSSQYMQLLKRQIIGSQQNKIQRAESYAQKSLFGQDLFHSIQEQGSLMNTSQARSFSTLKKSETVAEQQSFIDYLKVWEKVDFSILKSEDKNDKKPLSETIKDMFKKKDKSQEVDKKEKGAADAQGDKKAADKKKDDEEDLSEEEEVEDDKSKSKGAEEKDERNKAMQFLFEQDNSPKPEGWLAIVMAAATGYYLFNYKKPMKEIVYMEFLNDYLLRSQIKEINITKDRRSEVFNFRAEILTHDGEKCYMILNSYESFLAKLDMVQREMGKQPHEFIPVKYTNDSNQNLGANMINVIIGGMFLMFFYQIYKNRNGTGGMSTGKKAGKGGDKGEKKSGGFFGGGGGMNDMFGMGKSNAKQFGGEDGQKIKTRFRHVAGNEGAKEEVMEFVDFLKDPKKYQKLGARVPRGALLVGPPGCGKTLLAKAVAGESKVPFFTISGSDFVEMFVGVGASRVRDLFKKARAKAPSIIFIDEIDAVGKKRHGKMGGGNDERDNTLNQLLVEMDGFSTDTSVIILAATNRADVLDSALLRPGRFDRQVEITLPSLEERASIFRVHLKKILTNETFDKHQYSRKLAALTPGFSGADIQNICNEAAIMAARADTDSVSMKQFELATERVIAGIEKAMPKNEVQRRTVAYHEAGHAVAGWFSKDSAPLLKLTIIPRAKGSLGFAQYLPDEVSLYTKHQLLNMITVALGGRIAEELFFNKITTGASDDIKKCTQIAQGIVCEFGMVESLGAVNYSNSDGFQKAYSDKTATIIDQEVRSIINDQYMVCKELLESKREQIEVLAERLLEKETLSLPDIVDALGPRPFEQKASLMEYLEELKERNLEEEKEEAEQKAKAEEEEAKEEVDAAEKSDEPIQDDKTDKDEKK